MQTWYLIQQHKSGDSVRPRYRHELGGDRYTVTFYLGTDGEASSSPSEYPRIGRRLTYRLANRIWLSDSDALPWLEITTDDLSVVSDNFNKNWINLDDFLIRFEDSLRPPDSLNSLVGKAYYSGGSNVYPYSEYRITITGDSEQVDPAFTASAIQPDLYNYRRNVHTNLLNKLADNASALSAAAKKLDNAVALINAYVTIGLPKELNQSDVLRSALRAVPGSSELGLGSVDVTSLIFQIDSADNASGWADQRFNVTQIDALLNERIDLIADEIKRGLKQPTFAPDYVGWVLAELEHLKATALNLAIDDTYIVEPSGTVVVEALEGLLANDLNQLSGLPDPDTDPVKIRIDMAFNMTPGKGAVNVNEDGSFTYTAGPGFTGMDSFTYRSMATIVGAGPVYSKPATVVIRSATQARPEVIFMDGFEN